MNPIRSFPIRTGAALSAALVVCVPQSPALAAQTQQAAAPAAETDLDRALNALRQIETLQASFTQSDRTGNRISGTMTLRRPGKIRFQYAPGIPMLIVSDGSALTFVDYETRQVQRWPIKNSPLGALLDPARDVKKYGRLILTGDSAWVVVEIRDRSHPEYGVITLRFLRRASAPGGLELVGWIALDAQNRQTAITLSGHRYGIAVADNMFRYNDPRGPSRR